MRLLVNCPQCKNSMEIGPTPRMVGVFKVACKSCNADLFLEVSNDPNAANGKQYSIRAAQTPQLSPIPAAKSPPVPPPRQRAAQPPDEKPQFGLEDRDYEYQRGNTKFCHECGQKIRVKAEICPKCGVRQPDHADELSRPSKSRDGVKIPVLISAIANIVVGLIWAATCFGIVFTIPMVVLCIFEFILWSKADSLSLRQLGGRGKILGIFEIIVGLVNTVTLICGIIVLINSGKLETPSRSHS